MVSNVVEQVESKKFLGVVVHQVINWQTLLTFLITFRHKLTQFDATLECSSESYK